MNTPVEILPQNTPINVLDIGTGASCIYPILGQREYSWNFVASDIDLTSIKAAQFNISSNKLLHSHIQCRLQTDSTKIFNGIISETDFFHLTLCNPPFHRSLDEATQGTVRKWKNLGKTNNAKSKHAKSLNFGGQKAELWCPGGELAFITKMIKESKYYQEQVIWFTCLVSKQDHLSKIKLQLKKAKITNVKVINMTQGQKNSRFIAWSYYPKKE